MDTRQKAITRYALEFLKVNLEALEADELLEGFGGKITELEIEAIKSYLGIKFS